MAHFDLMSVREMIDSAFGEADSSCPVNINMIGSLLFILARRMQLLKRHFKVQMTDALAKNLPKSPFVVTEIKIHTKKKGPGTKTGIVADELFPSDKRVTGKLKVSTRKRSRKTSLHKSHSEKRFGGDSSSGMSTDGEVSTKKAHRRSSKKYTSDSHRTKMSHAERRKDEDDSEDASPDPLRKSRKYYDEKHTARQRKSGKYSDDKSSTGQRKAEGYSDQISTSKRGKTGKYSDEIATSGRRKAGKYTDDASPTKRIYEGERSKAGRFTDGKYSDEMSPDGRRRLSPRGRHRGGKYSDQMSPSERSRYSPTDELGSESGFSGKSRLDKHSAQRGKADANIHSQKDAAGRPRETGNNERKRGYDSSQRDDFDDDVEEKHEKIYVVRRTPSGRNIREGPNHEHILNPVATQDQFKSLLERTRLLQKKIGIKHTTAAKWDDLRSSTSLTNPKAALNMSVRLDVTEKRLARMLDVIEQLAHGVPGIDSGAFLDEKPRPLDAQKNFKLDFVSKPLSETPGAMTDDTPNENVQTFGSESEYDFSTVPEASKSKDTVTHGQFNEEIKKMREGLAKTIRHAMDDAGLHKCGQRISSTEVVVNQLNAKFNNIVKLAFAIDEFGNKVFAVDERLTLEMTTFQDNLLQMQTELEIAIEKMTDALLAPKEDAAAVAVITGDFNDYNKNLARTERIQIELKGELEAYLQNLKNVEERIKILRSRKCTRDEMFEKLNDKLTLRDINGILTEDQFYAVTNDMKQILQNLFLLIFTKECDWQRIIDEVKCKINEGADNKQIVTLNESIHKCFTKMDADVDEMFAIVGPLRGPPTDKTIERDNNCLCCGAPGETTKTDLSVKLWQEMLSRTHAVQSVPLPNADIAELCIPGQPIPHPLEQDSFVCEHDCGDHLKTQDVFDLYIKGIIPGRTNSERSVATSGKITTIKKHENA